MIGALAGEEMPLLAQSARVEILQRELERRFDRLRTARGEDDVAVIGAGRPQQQRGQLLERRAREQIAIAAGDLVELGGDRRVHLPVAVADAERRRAA